MLSLIARWSRRDLRARWTQVLAIALIVAMGAGAYAGLRSATAIREASINESFAASNFFDLRVRLAVGDLLGRGEMLDRLQQASSYDAVEAAEERLILSTQLETEAGDSDVFVPARLVGVSQLTESTVNTPYLLRGDVRKGSAILEHNFANHFGLPENGDLRLAGNHALPFSGHALLPEYFVVHSDEGASHAHASFAVVTVDLATVQALAGRPGAVNDLVLTVREGADAEDLRAELRSLFPTATVMDRDDDATYRLLTADVSSDEQMFTVIAVAILAGAVFAAYNFTGRMIEAQRREFGIAMALGLSPARIALRPLLFGLQVSVLGVLLGIGVGLLLVSLLTSMYESILPLPVWEAEFRAGTFVQAAVIGLLAPLAAIAFPVWRAVSVVPVEAIRMGHVAAGRSSGRAVRWLRRLHAVLPGDTFWQMPLRNLMRAPRRAALSIAGIAVALALLLAVSGILDSFVASLDRAEEHMLADRPDRLAIGLNQLEATDSPEVQTVLQSPSLVDAETGLRLEGRLLNGDESLDVVLQFVDMDSPLWQPGLREGAPPMGAGGVLIAEKAARDLGVGVGDRLTLHHPVLSAEGAYEAGESTLTVAGIHGGPFRFDVYLDRPAASLLGAADMTNVVWAAPAPGVDVNEARRELFASNVARSLVPVASVTEGFRDVTLQSAGLFRVAQGLMLIIAGLVAFNLASISMEERTREHATMLAFGVPVARVLRMSVLEVAIVGVLATVLGAVAGYLFLDWMMTELFPRQMPDMGLTVSLSPGTLLVTVFVGVFVVAAAPLLLVRRLRRMDIAGSLKVRE